MSSSYFATGTDEMSRAFDPSNTDAPPQSDTGASSDRVTEMGVPPAPASPPLPVRRTVVQQAVCPFCGIVNDVTAKTCRQCGMESTQATRQATRSKMGPWFVWQSRNPSAPGMSWATLISLVEKGRITTRSVVRGPTTGQLWRFAARVKGLSREFGFCWHCGAEVHRMARLCTACKRMQQPPLNLDALLETVDAAAPRAPLPITTHRGLLNMAGEPVRREVPPRDAPRPAAIQTAAAPNADAVFNPSVPIIDMEEEFLPASLQMRTFQLDEDDELQGAAHPGVFRRILIAGFLALAALAGALYFNPQVRPYYIRWYQQGVSWIASLKSSPSAAADKPTVSSPKTTESSHTPLMVVPKEAPKPVPAPSPPPAVKPPPTEIRIEPGASTRQIKPVVEAAEAENAEHRAWTLREGAIASEQRGDYADAVKKYEWIESLRLPEGVGPSDIESRLQQARIQLKQKSN